MFGITLARLVYSLVCHCQFGLAIVSLIQSGIIVDLRKYGTPLKLIFQLSQITMSVSIQTQVIADPREQGTHLKLFFQFGFADVSVVQTQVVVDFGEGVTGDSSVAADQRLQQTVVHKDVLLLFQHVYVNTHGLEMRTLPFFHHAKSRQQVVSLCVCVCVRACVRACVRE